MILVVAAAVSGRQPAALLCDKRMCQILIRAAKAARVPIYAHIRSKNRNKATAVMLVCSCYPAVGIVGEETGLTDASVTNSFASYTVR